MSIDMPIACQGTMLHNPLRGGAPSGACSYRYDIATNLVPFVDSANMHATYFVFFIFRD